MDFCKSVELEGTSRMVRNEPSKREQKHSRTAWSRQQPRSHCRGRGKSSCTKGRTLNKDEADAVTLLHGQSIRSPPQRLPDARPLQWPFPAPPFLTSRSLHTHIWTLTLEVLHFSVNPVLTSVSCSINPFHHIHARDSARSPVLEH